MTTPADRPAQDDLVQVPDVPTGWRARAPAESDVPTLVELRRRDQLAWTGSDRVYVAGVESEVAGPASWTRRQAVVEDPDGQMRAWVSVHDRAAGRTMVAVYVDRDVAEADEIALALYAWAETRARELSAQRGVTEVRLDASPYELDRRQLGWLERSGYSRRRLWLHMTRPVDTDEQLPELRPGVTIRPVDSHDNGLPVAADLQLVHQMLEESFEDHFNSYRESFPEFVQRLREDPGHRWDHWWLAFVDVGDALVPAGAVVCSVMAADADGREGTYVEYIGVNRNARGRGVAKGLLYTVIADAETRGRNRVGLEVDAESPTDADQLYLSLGWRTDYATESWFHDLVVR